VRVLYEDGENGVVFVGCWLFFVDNFFYFWFLNLIFSYIKFLFLVCCFGD